MSYSAEPYLHITDQLLTGLTGGVAREAHCFFANANSFGFEVGGDKLIPESVRVIGQVNEEFFAFQAGRDFIVTQSGTLQFITDPKNTGKAASTATWPDEASEFFVGYYHDESGKALLTDRNVGSLTRTLAESFAREAAVLRKQLELVYKSGFLETAEGSALDMVVALLGVERKKHDYSSGKVRFYRDSPAPADIYIPEGTRVSTALNPPVSFITTADRTLRRGQLSVEARIRAEVKGNAGLVAEKLITVINKTMLGISGVLNEAQTILGGSAESDRELRIRTKKVMERVGKATPHAIVNSLTDLPGLKENDIKLVEELQLRPGVVQLFVARDFNDQSNLELARGIRKGVLESRAAGIRVEHNFTILQDEGGVPISSAASREEGSGETISMSADFRRLFEFHVTVLPENPQLTGGEQDTIRKAIKAAVTSYMDGLPIGAPLIYNRIAAEIMAVPGVMDIDLLLREKEPTVLWGKRNIRVQAEKRGVLAEPESDLRIRFAGAPVSFNFTLKVTPNNAAAMAAIEKEIKEKLVDLFASLPSEVTSGEIMGMLGGSDLFTILPADLSWNVEYLQAGLIIRDQGGVGGSTTVPPGDKPILGTVTITAAGGGA